MPLRFLVDENVPGRIHRAIQRHNHSGKDLLDVVRVGEPDDLPISTDDSAILVWAENASRILITEDKSTMLGHLQQHLARGRSSPGVFLIRPGTTVPSLIEFLVLVAWVSDPTEWADRIEFVP
jgi:hypothetical protein